MATKGASIAVVGATGALGGELLEVLGATSLPVREIVPIATENSLGRDIEFKDEIYPVLTEAPPLRGLDLVILCAPPGPSLEFAREALRAEVPCIDVSGALATSREVPLRATALGRAAEDKPAPLVAVPPGPALACALVLRPLAQATGLRRVVGTLLEGASRAGTRGIEALHRESIALFAQQDPPEPDVFPGRVAFDCLPGQGPFDGEGRSESERTLTQVLERVLGGDVRFALTAVQVPAFAGQGASLHLETERPLDAKQAEELLEQAGGVEVWREEPPGLTLRAAAGRDVALVSRLRCDPSAENALSLWLVADTLRLAATNAVGLAAARLQSD